MNTAFYELSSVTAWMCESKDKNDSSNLHFQHSNEEKKNKIFYI